MAAQFLTEAKANTGPRVASGSSPPVRLHGGRGPYSSVLRLQRILGNQRVARMIRGENITAGGGIRGISRKTAIGAASGKYEQEVHSSAVDTPNKAIRPNIAGQAAVTRRLTLMDQQSAIRKIQRKDTCLDSSSDEARWAGQNEGKIFKSGDNRKEPTEAILWNFCVGESQLREQHRLSLKQDIARWKGLLVGTGKTRNPVRPPDKDPGDGQRQRQQGRQRKNRAGPGPGPEILPGIRRHSRIIHHHRGSRFKASPR